MPRLAQNQGLDLQSVRGGCYVAGRCAWFRTQAAIRTGTMPSSDPYIVSKPNVAAPPLPVILRIPAFGLSPQHFVNNPVSAQSGRPYHPRLTATYGRRQVRWRPVVNTAITIGILLGITGYIWRIRTAWTEPANRTSVERIVEKTRTTGNLRTNETSQKSPEKSVVLVQKIIPVD